MVAQQVVPTRDWSKDHSSGTDLRRIPYSRLAFETLALLAIALTVAVRSLATTDLSFYDEVAYMARGLDQSQGVWARFTDGATYSSYYWLLSTISSDPIGLYFVGRAGASVLFVLGVWLASRLLTNASLAWAAAAVAAALPVTYVWPSVSAPAAGAILVGLASAIRFRSPVGLGILAGTFWLAAGSRPEFLWAALLASILSLGALFSSIWHRHRSGHKLSLPSSMAVLGGSVLVPLTLLELHGSPLQDDGRNWVAFGQHYSLRNALSDEDPWLQWDAIVQRGFPGSNSVVDALLNHPVQVWQHITLNALELPTGFLTGALGLSIASTPFAWLLVGLLVSSMLVSLLISPRSTIQKTKTLLRSVMSGNKASALVVLAVTLVAVAIPVLIIHPRIHYLLIPAGLVLIGIVYAQFRVGSSKFASILPLALVAIVFVMYSVSSLRLIVNRVAYPPPLTHAAATLIQEGEAWVLLGVDWGLEVFVPGLEQISDVEPLRNETFAQLLERNRVNAILLNDRFELAKWRDAEGFPSFLQDPRRFGFTPLAEGSNLWIRSR